MDFILKLFGGSAGGAVAGVAKATEDISIANLVLGKGFPAALILGSLYYLSKLTYRNFSQTEDNAGFQLFRAGYMLQDGVKILAGVAAMAFGVLLFFSKH